MLDCFFSPPPPISPSTLLSFLNSQFTQTEPQTALSAHLSFYAGQLSPQTLSSNHLFPPTILSLSCSISISLGSISCSKSFNNYHLLKTLVLIHFDFNVVILLF